MKKLFTALLTLVMVIGMLAGCGSDPVAEDLEKFINSDMVAVNQKYEDLKAEMARWQSLEDDAALVVSLKDTVLPNLDQSLELLSKINPQTEEVKAIKDKYKKVLDTYKEGYQGMLSASEAGDEAGLDKATEKLDEAVKLLDEYNQSMEKLAKEKNMEVSY